MENKYDFKKIERRWQEKWEDEKTYACPLDSKKKKYYALFEFPYPSGDGLHMGHVRPSTAMDIISRKRRMQGYNVLYPIGWDAFGLPTENYAIKTGVSPQEATKKNTENFENQFRALGMSFDWDRLVNTTDPSYYKWTQWMFKKFFENGLAYKKAMKINWCPSCKIGLANEEVISGNCERCGSPVEQKDKEQWMLAITKYADRLLEGLKDVDYIPSAVEGQKNWIGRSEGAEIRFNVVSEVDGVGDKNAQTSTTNTSDTSDTAPTASIEVFTTRPDTIFGATYLVLAPEHAFVSEQIRNPKSEIRNKSEIEKYVNEAQAKTELERQADQKGKTGVELRGVKAINPATNEEIPVWVADYVLGGYGTGAIMAVPAHDGRDFEFAKKFSLPMRVVVKASSDYADMDQVKLEEFAKEIVKLAKDKDFQATLVGGMARSAYENGRFGLHSDADIFVDRKGWEIIGDYLKEKGFDVKSNSGSEKMPGSHSWENHQWFWRDGSGVWLDMFLLEEENGVYFDNVGSQKLIWGDKTALRSLTVNDFEFTVPSKELLEQISQNLSNSWDKCFMDSGILTNSGEFSGMKSEEARAKMTEKFGTPKVQYKLRDWVFSRQRYWGEPIPLIYCAACAQKSKGSSNNQTPNSKHDRKDFSEGERQNPGWFAVPDEELPVELPKVENYQPRDDGESPLASVEEWVNTKCPKCDGPAKRETDTMPNWAGSSWYFLGYCIAENLNNQALISKQVKSKEIQDAWKYFMPVDWYNGGMEHVTLHLLYSRFWNMVLHDLGFVPNGEPYKKRTAQGMILAEGGVKMSKSKGNVINPNELVEKFGADAVRLYEMFIGPFDQAVAWDKRGILGPARFLEKVWRVGQSSPDSSLSASGGAAQNDKLRRLLHKTIKKVSDDIEAMSFNTAISSMMEFINEVAGPVIPASEPPARNASPSEAGGESRSRIKSGMTNDISGMTISRGDFKKFLQLLAPFAPHITSELYEKMGGENIDFQKWPEHDASLMLEDSFDLVVQVNGKTRGTINVASGINEQEAEALVRASEIGKKWLGGELKKVIYVPDRLINFIV